MRRAVHVIVEGRVQGVGFRAFVEREAMSRGLSGWVRNRADGAVEAVFCGEDSELLTMVEACRQGPRFSRVTSLSTAPHPVEDWTEFAIWPTA